MLLKELSTPGNQFTFYRFKDTLKIEDFGGIQEATFRLPIYEEFENDQENQHIFIFGDESFQRVVLHYDILKDNWEQQKLADQPGMMEKFYNCSASIAIDSKQILVTGGGSPPQASVRLFDVEEFVLKKDSKMICPRNAHAIAKCQGTIYVMGGFSGKERLNTVEKYNLVDKTWDHATSMKH